MSWPANDILELGSVAGDPYFTKVYQIAPDASYKTLDWVMKDSKMVIKTQLFAENLTAWVIKIERGIPSYPGYISFSDIANQVFTKRLVPQ